MWAERERWRQRVRVGVFVVAVSTLLTAWWRYERDPRSMPALLSPIDRWIGDSTAPDSRSPSSTASPNSDRSGAAPQAAGVGTTGRSGNPDANYRTPAQGSVRSGSVSRPAASDINRAVPNQKNRERSPESVPCEPRSEKGADAAPKAPGNDAVPCEEPSPETGRETVPSGR